MTLGPDLVLDPTTHDLQIVDGDLVIATDVAQAVKIRTLFVRGEWFLDLQEGTRYYEVIWIKPVNLDHVAAELRSRIVGTPGVGAITKFVLDFDETTRTLTVDWAATTDEGEIADVSTLNLGAP